MTSCRECERLGEGSILVLVINDHHVNRGCLVKGLTRKVKACVIRSNFLIADNELVGKIVKKMIWREVRMVKEW